MIFISRGIKLYAAAGAAAVVLGLFAAVYHAGRSHQRTADQAEIRRISLQAENAEARADSTHHVKVATAPGSSDSTDVAYRRAQQLKLQAQQLGDSIRIKRMVSAQLTLQADTLRARIAAVTHTDSAGTRTASFHEQQGPVTVDVAVSMPAADSATARILATVRAPVIDVDVGCRDAAAGIRSAYVTASAPGWGSVQIGGAVVAPDVCNPLPVEARRSIGQRIHAGIPWMVAGAGVTAAAVKWGPRLLKRIIQ